MPLVKETGREEEWFLLQKEPEFRKHSMSVRYKTKWEDIVHLILLLILVIVGLAVRLHEVHYSLDGDEIFSVKLASKQFAEVVLGSLQDRPHPPLHNVLLHLWIKAFGASEVSARSLSVSFSGAFLLMSYLLLRRLVSGRLALGVLSILALSPLFVYYGQEARPYALIAFLSTVNLFAFIRVVEVPCDPRRTVIWAVSCALLLYAQYLAALLIASQIVLALFYLRSERLKILAYGLVGSAFLLPWVIAAFGNAFSNGTELLPHINWMGPPTPTDFVWFYVSMFGEVPGLQTRWLLIMLAVLGVTYVRRLATSRNLPLTHVLLFVIGIGVPAVVYVVSVWGSRPIFVSRQLLGAGIAFIATIGLCIAVLPRSVAIGFLLGVVLWTASGLPTVFPHNAKPPWRDIAEQIDSQYDSRGVVAQESWVSGPLAFYRRAGSVRRWSDLTEYEKADRQLFACRPFRCSTIETKGLESHRSLLKTWRWGRSGEPTQFNQLFLYEIGSVNQARL